MLKARKKKSETIAGMIRENLLGHPLPAGTPVASSREIARKYKGSLSTADQALNLLVQEDFLYRTKGSGTFLKLDSYARPLRIGVADQIVSSQYLSPEINRILNMHFEIVYLCIYAPIICKKESGTSRFLSFYRGFLTPM